MPMLRILSAVYRPREDGWYDVDLELQGPGESVCGSSALRTRRYGPDEGQVQTYRVFSLCPGSGSSADVLLDPWTTNLVDTPGAGELDYGVAPFMYLNAPVGEKPHPWTNGGLYRVGASTAGLDNDDFGVDGWCQNILGEFEMGPGDWQRQQPMTPGESYRFVLFINSLAGGSMELLGGEVWVGPTWLGGVNGYDWPWEGPPA